MKADTKFATDRINNIIKILFIKIEHKGINSKEDVNSIFDEVGKNHIQNEHMDGQLVNETEVKLWNERKKLLSGFGVKHIELAKAIAGTKQENGESILNLIVTSNRHLKQGSGLLWNDVKNCITFVTGHEFKN